MDISGLVSYDHLGSRATSSAASSRGMMMPHLDLNLASYPQSNMDGFVGFPSTGYGYHHMTTAGYQQMLPAYSTPYQPMSHPAPLQPAHDVHPGLPHVRDALDGLARDGGSPMVKSEDGSMYRGYPLHHEQVDTYSVDSKISTSTVSSGEAHFATDVDTLMKAIQAKSKPNPQRRLPLPSQSPQTIRSTIAQPQLYSGGYAQEPAYADTGMTVPKTQRSKKRYTCEIPGCSKSFFQKTHLEIHTRAHTGVKPFICKEPACGQRFSQLGNLKTHERRHTGERPYQCDVCGKRFAQRGNVRAHKIVHEQSKPFLCKLEDCRKQFTQLGNLKSHQNKFHAQTLKHLTLKFATMREGDPVSAADKELWEYFATLYKNSNKGIKGRGKDRKIAGPNSPHKRDDRSCSSDLSGRSENGQSHHGAYDFNEGMDVEGDDHDDRRPTDFAFADRKMY